MLAVGDCTHRDHVIPTCTQPTAGLRAGRKEEGEWWVMTGDNYDCGWRQNNTRTYTHTYTKKRARDRTCLHPFLMSPHDYALCVSMWRYVCILTYVCMLWTGVRSKPNSKKDFLPTESVLWLELMSDRSSCCLGYSCSNNRQEEELHSLQTSTHSNTQSVITYMARTCEGGMLLVRGRRRNWGEGWWGPLRQNRTLEESRGWTINFTSGLVNISL